MTFSIWIGEGIPEFVISKALSVNKLRVDDTGQSCLFDPGMFWDHLVELLYKNSNEIQEASPKPHRN